MLLLLRPQAQFLGIVSVTYWYDSQGTMGKVICPRLVDFQ
jgi:hypothetical protein